MKAFLSCEAVTIWKRPPSLCLSARPSEPSATQDLITLVNYVHPAISGASGEAVAIIFMLESYSLKKPPLTLTFCCFSESEGRPSPSSGG